VAGQARAPQAGRILELDALRGLAVIGIALMNVFAFAMPGAAYYNPAAWGAGSWADYAAWALSFVLVEDKFRVMFAMMFGAGVSILLDRPALHPLRAHYARMAVLFVIGFLHALLLFSGDVLRLYALCGLVLPLAARWPVRRLWIGVAVLLAVHLAAGGYIAWGWLEYWWRFAHVPGTDPAPLAPIEAAFGADPAALERGLAIGREALGERIARRWDGTLGGLVAGLVVLPTTLAAMLAGIALWRNGLLAAQWPARRAMQFAWRLAFMALPPLVLLAWFAFYAEFHGAVIGTNALVWSAPFDLVLGIAWTGFAMALSRRCGQAGGVVRRLAAAGRMALTNYLLTSVLLAAIYGSWGLGLFGTTGRLASLGVTLLPMAGALLWSPIWLAYFRQGPCEWLWRGAASLTFAPLRR